ncbi:aldose 1-epimerase family protein [Acetobacteraceae bacterium KSS8]|uniref:Aldose 1-epimerase family protein n=1 Tax=Endosaccharibacter trunci TaxID=2812733 RepID=A0ABT1W611_9PROT|nr:aldose 1-epimerase family protein [Acetobacteraceae bacterium KSS8]
MSDPDTHQFGNADLALIVKADGAELCSLRAGDREMLWQAGPEWKRHAPVLFPVVGRLKNDTLRRDGRDYSLGQHGFARDRRFDWISRDAQGCRLSLRSDAESLEHFPYPFMLEIGYRLDGPALHVDYLIRNPGPDPLPCSIGAHPAFRWPLADDADPLSHRLVFERAEPEPIRRVRAGLLTSQTHPSPIRDGVLPLDPALFEDDAVILMQPASHSVRFEAAGAPLSLRIGWHGMNALGIWSKPGAAFLCIEPWHGFASPEAFDGPFEDKPGLMRIAPGASAALGWSVAVER